MKHALILLLTLTYTAHAKMQFMECKTEVRSNVYKAIKGNVDLEAGTSQTLLVFQYHKDKVVLGEYVYAREIQSRKLKDGRTQVWTDWMHDFEFTLPRPGGDEGEVRMAMQDGISETVPSTVKCTLIDEDEDRLKGRELCFNHRTYCNKFARFPKADEREQFLKDALEYEKTKPILAVRRLIDCEGTMKATKTSFVIQGTMGIPVGDNPTVAQYSMGTFVVNASTAGDSQLKYRVYKPVDLTIENDWKSKTITLRTEDSDKFSLKRSYDGNSWEAVIRGEERGMTQSFAGKMTCKEERLPPDELAGFEHCNEMYLGCVSLRRARGDLPLPRREDLDDLRAFHKLEVDSARRKLKQ